MGLSHEKLEETETQLQNSVTNEKIYIDNFQYNSKTQFASDSVSSKCDYETFYRTISLFPTGNTKYTNIYRITFTIDREYIDNNRLFGGAANSTVLMEGGAEEQLVDMDVLQERIKK